MKKYIILGVLLAYCQIFIAMEDPEFQKKGAQQQSFMAQPSASSSTSQTTISQAFTTENGKRVRTYKQPTKLNLGEKVQEESNVKTLKELMLSQIIKSALERISDETSTLEPQPILPEGFTNLPLELQEKIAYYPLPLKRILLHEAQTPIDIDMLLPVTNPAIKDFNGYISLERYLQRKRPDLARYLINNINKAPLSSEEKISFLANAFINSINNNNENTALYLFDVIQKKYPQLLKTHKSKEYSYDKALLWAIGATFSKVVEKLLDLDPDGRPQELSWHPYLINLMSHYHDNNFSQTMEMLNLLIKRGVNINSVDYRGQTALMTLAEYNHPKYPNTQLIIDFLIKHKINPNAVDQYGDTAFIIAAKKNSAMMPYLAPYVDVDYVNFQINPTDSSDDEDDENDDEIRAWDFISREEYAEIEAEFNKEKEAYEEQQLALNRSLGLPALVEDDEEEATVQMMVQEFTPNPE